MSCCNNGPVVVKVYPNAPPACPDTPVYVFSNANLSGEGVFFDHTGTNVQFYGISSSGGTIDVTLDAPNNTINIDIDDAIIAGSVPDSTTVIKGKTAYSTNAEALAKTSTTKAVTPSNFAAMGSSTTFAGLVELATQAETQTGTSTVLAVTPDGLKSVTNTMLVTAVVANAGARGAYDPSATGQLLIQQDTGALYKATSNTIGDFDLAAVPLSGVADVTGLTLGASGELEFGGAETRTTMPWAFEADVNLQADVNFDAAGTNTISRNGTLIPANSVLITSGVAGKLSYIAADQFLGSYAVQTYVPSNFTTQRSLNAGAATLAEVADVLATLINDLAATVKPQL